MGKSNLLYYTILQYEDTVICLIKKHFNIINLKDPMYDTDEVLEKIEIALAPLGFPFGKEKINRCPKLKVIASSTLNVPHIDVDYARSKGIQVCWLSEDQRPFLESITPTAELCWGLIIALIRRIPWVHEAVCSGQWDGRSFGRKTPRMLSNMTLGIIGIGRIGALVASYGSAFGMKVCYFSPSTIDPAYTRCDTLTDLAKVSDVVSLHAHLTAETEKMIDKQFFSVMKPGSFFINTARGAIVDEDALLAVLENGRLAGAALDVFAQEYQPDFQTSLPQSPLIQYARSHDKLLLTPHYAGATVDAWEMTQRKTIELIIDECKTFP